MLNIPQQFSDCVVFILGVVFGKCYKCSRDQHKYETSMTCIVLFLGAIIFVDARLEVVFIVITFVIAVGCISCNN